MGRYEEPLELPSLSAAQAERVRRVPSVKALQSRKKDIRAVPRDLEEEALAEAVRTD